jgi:hypothetical protein
MPGFISFGFAFDLVSIWLDVATSRHKQTLNKYGEDRGMREIFVVFYGWMDG